MDSKRLSLADLPYRGAHLGLRSSPSTVEIKEVILVRSVVEIREVMILCFMLSLLV